MIGNKIIKFTTIDSTNKYIKDNVFSIEPGTIVIAEYQTNGYGRLSRTWFNNSSLDLTFSLLLKQKIHAQTTLISQLVGASLITALEEFQIDATIKWPNDIIVNNKKIAGVLVESKIVNEDIYLIIGIGLNVNSLTFNDSIAHKATSLKSVTNHTYDLDVVLKTIVTHLNNFMKQFNQSNYNFLEICRSKNALLNKEVVIESTNDKGIVVGIDDDGSLILLINNKKKKFIGSEVTLSSSYNVLGE